MSADSTGSGAGRREVAYRLFAAEYDDATLSYSESDEERAPNYVVTPTGARVNRLFLVGVLTELERVNEEMLRARVVDPTGAFVVYAGQYQPDALTFLERAEPPAFLAVTGKARTFQPEDSDRVYTSVRPESISEVDADTRDRWVVATAEQTLDRVATMAAATSTGLRGDDLRAHLESEGVDPGVADGVALAIDHYGTTGDYLAAVRETALDAARVVADEREEVSVPGLAPGEGGDDPLEALAAGEVAGGPAEAAADHPTADDDGGAEPATASADATGSGDEPGDRTPAGGGAEPTEAPESAPEAEAEPEPEPESERESSESTEPATVAGSGPGDAAGTDDLGDFEPGEFDLDEETRREVEAEHGVDFETGNEVDDPGEADIEHESPAAGAETTAEADAATGEREGGSDTEPESEPATEPDTEPEPEQTAGTEPDPDQEEPADASEHAREAESADDTEDVDLDEAVIAVMADLADDEGADREAVVAAVTEEYGVGESEVEDAIQDALMSGQCYEPGEGRLKPI